MFEKYKKEIKKYDINLRINKVFTIAFIITVLISAFMIYAVDLNYFLKLLIIVSIEIVIIFLGLIIIYLWNINKFKTNEKNLYKKFKKFLEMEKKKKYKYIIKLLKEHKVDTPEKVLFIINFYKDKNNKITFSQPQNFFGLFVIFMGMSADFYEPSIQNIDVVKIGISFGFTIVSILIYLVIILIKYIITNICFYNKFDIYEKFMNTLNEIYLDFDNIKNKIK